MYGADIEFLLYDKVNRRPIPVCGLVGGTKESARKLSDTYSCLEDNVTLELNYTPQQNSSSFTNVLSSSLSVITDIGEGRFVPMLNPECKFPKAALAQHENAMEFGCDADYSAYSTNPEVERPTPDIEEIGNWRFAGGHLHLEYKTKDSIPAWVAARLMDLYVTVPFTSWVMLNSKARSIAARNTQVNKILGAHRKQYYGLPGLHRQKPYGVEYRTLSNFYTYKDRHCYLVAGYLAEVKRVLEADADLVNSIYMAINWDDVHSAIVDTDEQKLFALQETSKKLLRANALDRIPRYARGI